jgi:hypothetical protein
MVSCNIPIYIQYTDKSGNPVTEEISIKDAGGGTVSNSGVYVTLETSNYGNSSVKFKYYPSNIRSAASQAEKWAKENKRDSTYFGTWIFTTDATQDWWTQTLPSANYGTGGAYYTPFSYAWSKVNGYGIIFRSYNAPELSPGKPGLKRFTEEMVPI